MKLLKNLHNKLSYRTGKFMAAAFAAAGLFLFTSCMDDSRQTVVIWTSRSEIVPYAEVFNTSQNKIKALVLYKKNPVESLPATKDEVPPDLVIGSFLRTERKRRQFRSLNYLFTTGEVNESVFYNNLLDSCKKNESIYQIPVSFNIPAIVFTKEHEEFVKEAYMLTLEQIQEAATLFNKKNKNGLYTQMGFAPQWEPQFLYMAAKIRDCKFEESGTSFSCNLEALSETVDFLRAWTTKNGSPIEEQDFAFKYLYTPQYKQLLSKHCLFSFMTSDKLFALSQAQLETVDFRWIHKNNKIPVDDSMITMGLYNKAKHKSNAEEFIKWFFTEEAQKQMMEHVHQMNLNVSTFGIAGGFSSIKDVTEKVFPTYYNTLLSNAPVAELLMPPAVLPLRWESLKDKVIIPYIADSINSNAETKVRSIEERTSDWTKQIF